MGHSSPQVRSSQPLVHRLEPQALHVCRSFLGKPAENLALYTYPAYFSKLTMYCTLTEGSAGA